MGDRALIVLKDEQNFSPVAYLHWHAPQVQNYINRLREVVQSRGADLNYAFARLSGIIHNDIDGNLSFGVWNLPADFDGSDDRMKDMSHGDGGVYLVDINDDYSIKCVGGYGIDSDECHKTKRDGGEADRTASKKIAEQRAA